MEELMENRLFAAARSSFAIIPGMTAVIEGLTKLGSRVQEKQKRQ